jgi:hypothetical protein
MLNSPLGMDRPAARATPLRNGPLGDYLLRHVIGIAAYAVHRVGVIESIEATIKTVLRRRTHAAETGVGDRCSQIGEEPLLAGRARWV